MIQTLEPRIESSLLYTREDGTQAFVHDSYRDFLATRRIVGLYLKGAITDDGLDDLFFSDFSASERRVYNIDDNIRFMKRKIRHINEKAKSALYFVFIFLAEYYNHFIREVLEYYDDGELCTGICRSHSHPTSSDLVFVHRLVSVNPSSDKKLVNDVEYWMRINSGEEDV